MKGFYIENFFLRILFCVVTMLAVFIGISYIKNVVIGHGTFELDIFRHVIGPVLCGVTEAIVWKPKQ